MSKNNLVKKIEEITKTLLSKMSFKVKIKAYFEEEVIFVDIETEFQESGLLIGRGGESLEALQYILRLLALKEGKFTPILLNIEDYRQKEERQLKKLATSFALKVKAGKHPEILPPMSAYQRRLAHLALAEIDGIEEESVGEEPNRRIVIRPKG